MSTINNTRGFKKKTIVKNIIEKMDDWIKSISDTNLRDQIKSDYIVTGGAIASMLQGQLPNDYDVYFKTPEIAKNVTDYYLNKISSNNERVKIFAEITNQGVKTVIKSAGIAGQDSMDDYQYFESLTPAQMDEYFDKWKMKSKSSYAIALISSNAISLNDDIQIITRFVGNPAEIHKNYDFIHTTNYYTPSEGLVLNQPALESILAKELKYVGSLYPICSMFRIKKFIERGWTITAGEMLKIAFDINKLNLTDMNILKEQLIGVDAAYFNEVLSILNETNSKELDRTYLFEVINRVFDSEKSN